MQNAKKNLLVEIEKGDVEAVKLLSEICKQNQDYIGLCNIWEKINNNAQTLLFRSITFSIFNLKLDKIITLNNKNMFLEFVENYVNFRLLMNNKTGKFVGKQTDEIYEKNKKRKYV